jgi:hypothetical protein
VAHRLLTASTARFDAPVYQLDCRLGEVLIDSINSVEDTKGC